jgi:predicted transcriptional regulator
MGARVQHTARYRELCGLLRAWRIGAGLSQRELAERLKKPPSFVHKCEVGGHRIDPIEFVDWCIACGVARAKAIKDVEGIS